VDWNEEKETENILSHHIPKTVSREKTLVQRSCALELYLSTPHLSPGWTRKDPGGLDLFSEVNFLKLWPEALASLNVRESDSLLVIHPSLNEQITRRHFLFTFGLLATITRIWLLSTKISTLLP
jgi:hypothetical protein